MAAIKTPKLSEMKGDRFCEVLQEIVNIDGFKNETDVREDFILPLLKALGYSNSRTNPNRIEREVYLQVPELIIGRKKRSFEKYVPDYILQIGNQRKWLIDAKGPNESCSNTASISQAHSYSIHREVNVGFFVLCNGEDFVVYRTADQNYQSFLHFRRDEFEDRWKELWELFSAKGFEERNSFKLIEGDSNQLETVLISNNEIAPITQIIEEKKQASRIHNGPHPYFTKRAWNVVRAYIENFTKPGDLVLDPYCGSGTTAIEAMLTNRRSVTLDINPIAIFISKVVSKPIDTALLHKTYESLHRKLEEYIKRIKEEKINKPEYWYPKDALLPPNADVHYLHEYFSRHQLTYLSYLRHQIALIKNKDTREAFLLIFSSMLVKCNKSFHNTPRSGGSQGGGDAGLNKYYRFQLPATLYREQDPLKTLQDKYTAFQKAQVSLRQNIKQGTPSDDFKHFQDVYENLTDFRNGTATNIHSMSSESVDYIFTDPPYGSKIGYLDCSILWNEWQKFKVTDDMRSMEAIVKGRGKKAEDDYISLIQSSLQEMYRVLKPDKWMSVVFASDKPSHWHALRDFAISIGFEHVNTVCAPSKRKTVKKNQNPLTVFKGAMILNFRKRKSNRNVVGVTSNISPTGFVLNCAEATIVKNKGSASIETIMEEMIPKLWESGLLAAVENEVEDIVSLLKENFSLDAKSKKWKLKDKSKIGSHIPLSLRIEFYIKSCLNKAEAETRHVSIDEIIMEVIPFLRNGMTPTNQDIILELKKIAYSPDDKHWVLKRPGELNFKDTF